MSKDDTRTILLANPHGFCAGVTRAIDIMHASLRAFPGPVYGLHEVVHNQQVVQELVDRGVTFVDEIESIPKDSTVIFSAHGVPPSVRDHAAGRGLNVIDATCPFVTKVHREVRQFASRGLTVLLLGNPRHDEIVGVVGEAPESVIVIPDADAARAVEVPDPERVAVAMQTTLSDAQVSPVLALLNERFPRLVMPSKSDVCYATTNRQAAVREVARRVPLVMVIGSANSANSVRLVDVARAEGARAELVSTLEDLAPLNVDGLEDIGLTAGASTPQAFVDEVLARLKEMGFARVEVVSVASETMEFPLPAALRNAVDAEGESGSKG